MCDINDYQQEYTAAYRCLRTPLDNNENNGELHYRYLLQKEGEKPLIIIGCNPSDANEGQSDQTMIRVSKFCQIKGYGGYIMLNLYPQIDSDVRALPLNIDDINSINYIVHSVNIKIINKVISENNNSIILFAFGTVVNRRKRLFRCCYDSLKKLINELIKKNIIRKDKIKKLDIPNERGYPTHFSRLNYIGIAPETVGLEEFDFRNFQIQ